MLTLANSFNLQHLHPNSALMPSLQFTEILAEKVAENCQWPFLYPRFPCAHHSLDFSQNALV